MKRGLLTSFFCCWTTRRGEGKARTGPQDDVEKVEHLAQLSSRLLWYSLSLKNHTENLPVFLIPLQGPNGTQMDWVGCPSPVTPIRKQTSARRRDASLPVGQMVLFMAKRQSIPRRMSVTSDHETGRESDLRKKRERHFLHSLSLW